MDILYAVLLIANLVCTLFEIVARQAVAAYAESIGVQLIEPEKQNHYPDFTLMHNEEDQDKIALDVKTTYREGGQSKFQYTLGSYTSYIHPETRGKNIVYPFNEYGQHWVIGFVYRRIKQKQVTSSRIYSFDTLKQIPVPFDNVEVFMQEKWRISGDRAGSGNTANIGSINGVMKDFEMGNGVFHSEEEFLEYWRGYKRTAQERQLSYSNIHEFRVTCEQLQRENNPDEI